VSLAFSKTCFFVSYPHDLATLAQVRLKEVGRWLDVDGTANAFRYVTTMAQVAARPTCKIANIFFPDDHNVEPQKREYPLGARRSIVKDLGSE
jgi:hypothetical protein